MSEPVEELAQAEVNKSRRRFVMLLLVAFVPIFIAYSAFEYFPEWVPSGTTNQGELIRPPVQAADIDPALERPGNWVLIQPVAFDCDEDCLQLMYLSRQVVIGLGKDSTRVRRVILAPDEISGAFNSVLEQEHPDVGTVNADASSLEGVDDTRPLLFLMDPNGNIIMYYTLETAGKPMMKDLKHLLRISSIG